MKHKSIWSTAALAVMMMSGCGGGSSPAPSGYRFLAVRDDVSPAQAYIGYEDGTITPVMDDAYFGALGKNNKIVYSKSVSGNTHIFIANADGTGETQLTTAAGTNNRPNFNHAGTRIVFHSNRDGNFEIYVMDVNGANQTRLTNSSTDDAQPSFSWDDTKIVWHSNAAGNYDIWTMNADGTNQQNRTASSTEDDYCAAFFPNGKIVFGSERDTPGSAALYTMNGDGTGVTPFVDVPGGGDAFPSVTPDGQFVFFCHRVGNDSIWVTPVASPNPTAVHAPGVTGFINTGTMIRYRYD
jgi:Tol biopolymer transport system component